MHTSSIFIIINMHVHTTLEYSSKIKIVTNVSYC